ncbi:BolA/IbaG family iron-sulfur metabolism protein [bacterium]|jgi:acid stress-induced BolA-like protein IbaG/YrbA|nr:BolA/IbaG family iron-sulfur metabolism protein [bacterium]NBW57777.1 BolA/IbaG family iron-sulfur metabolism protein [bacterium]NBX72284.1 BolA/IbaG family iron-sulfur metabolism protein [bacterium]
MDATTLHKVLFAHFSSPHITIDGDEYHRLITIVSDDFIGLSRLKRQQQVNQALFQYIQDGSLHAVTLKTLTVNEAQNAKQP